MKPAKKQKRKAVTYRLQLPIRKLIAQIAFRENISQTRLVELCVERHSADVAKNPFPTSTLTKVTS